MTKYTTTLLAVLALMMAGCTQPDSTSREDIAALKAGQQEIRAELAEIRKLLEPKAPPSRVAEIDLAMNITGDPVQGDSEAPLVIVEYTDYQCPFCARHANAVLPLIKKEYVDTGKVRYVARDFPLPFHKQAGKAGEAAHCAGDQGKYWEMHDQLFDNQKALAEEQLVGYAGNAGLDAAEFKRCLDSGKYADKVAQNIAEARKADINGTPSFVIGYPGAGAGEVQGARLLRGALDYASFQQVFDELLAARK